MCPWGLCLNYPRHCVGWDLEFLAMTQINMSSYNLSTAVLGWFYDDGKSIPWLPASCPKMVAVALRWVWGEREALRLISGLFQSLTLRHLGSQCGLGLCLASMGVFVSPDRSFFFCLSLALERLQQQFFSSFSKWTGWFGFGPRSESGGKDDGPLHFGPTSWKKLSQQEKAHLLHLLWRGGQHQRLTGFHICLPKLLLKSTGFVFFFFLCWFFPESSCDFVPTKW